MRAWAGGHGHGRWAVWAAPCTLLTLVRFAGFAGYFEGKVPSGRREFIFFLTPGKKRNLLEALGLSGGPGGANPAWPARRQERRHRHRPTVGGADRYRTLVSTRPARLPGVTTAPTHPCAQRLRRAGRGVPVGGVACSSPPLLGGSVHATSRAACALADAPSGRRWVSRQAVLDRPDRRG